MFSFCRFFFCTVVLVSFLFGKIDEYEYGFSFCIFDVGWVIFCGGRFGFCRELSSIFDFYFFDVSGFLVVIIRDVCR